ncbi:uncharacterized protein LOC129849799 isoform X3 [Salvelinus fontinalis]|nr:uncharacterized protein LOC129849799 isoform X3 [Salvelinus fontinalis]
MQEADLKTDGTSQSQKVEGESELDDAVAIPPHQSQEVEGESELDEAIVIPSQSPEEAKGESELNQVDLKTATSTLTLEVEGESVMQESDDLETAGPSQSQETERVAKAAVVTFTTVTHKAAASQTSLTLSKGKRSYPDLHTFVQDMKDGHWNLLSENMRAGISRHEFSARCMDITNWVMESTSTVVIPALDLTMQIELSDSSSSSGSGSNEAREVTSLGHSVRFSFSGGPSRRTSSRTACSTRTPTPFPSSHRSMTSLLSEDGERYVCSPEGGDREMRHRPHSAPLRSVFGISEDSVFNMVQSGQTQSDIVLSSSWSRREKYSPVKKPPDTRFMMDTSNAASDITHGVVADLNATEEFPARGLSPADVKADGMARLPSARGEEIKKNRKWGFLPKIGKIPKIRMKLFKTKGEPKSHPEQDALPTKRLRETRISQNAECEVPEVPSTSPPKEDLTTTLAPAPQESQSRKRPLIVRVLRAISRAVSKPFRGAFGKKN